jgi:predicted nucleic acid-binding protein
MTVVGAPKEEADEYLTILTEMAVASGGSAVAPPRTVHDCRDHEDNLVLDLAAEVGALLIVSDDGDLTSKSPWRGVPILRAREFAGRVDAMRRHRR